MNLGITLIIFFESKFTCIDAVMFCKFQTKLECELNINSELFITTTISSVLVNFLLNWEKL